MHWPNQFRAACRRKDQEKFFPVLVETPKTICINSSSRYTMFSLLLGKTWTRRVHDKRRQNKKCSRWWQWIENFSSHNRQHEFTAFPSSSQTNSFMVNSFIVSDRVCGCISPNSRVIPRSPGNRESSAMRRGDTRTLKLPCRLNLLPSKLWKDNYGGKSTVEEQVFFFWFRNFWWNLML